MQQAQPGMGLTPGAADPNQVSSKPRQMPGGSAGNPTMPGDGGSMFGDDASAEADDGADSSDGGDTDQPSGFASMGSLAMRVEAAMDVVRADMPGISDEEAYQVARTALMTHQAALQSEADWHGLDHAPNVRPHPIQWSEWKEPAKKAFEFGRDVVKKMMTPPDRTLPPQKPHPSTIKPEPEDEPTPEPHDPLGDFLQHRPYAEPEDQEYEGRHREPDALGSFLDEYAGPQDRREARWKPFDDLDLDDFKGA